MYYGQKGATSSKIKHVQIQINEDVATHIQQYSDGKVYDEKLSMCKYL